MTSSNFDISLMFFLQIALILGACRLVGMIARAVGQPEVIGQMIAGVLLGPSLLGHFFPDVQGRVFPAQSRTVIYVVAHLGIALYMFLIGLEFRKDLFRAKVKAAAFISVSGMVAPFALGMICVALLFDHPGLFEEKISRIQAMLFLGAAMSITAFPVMARIVAEKGLSNTSIGTLLLAAGSINDAAAWCVLAVLLSMMGDGWTLAAKSIGGGMLYVVLAFALLRPFLRWLSRETPSTSAAGSGTSPVTGKKLVIVLVMLAAASWYTDVIGIYEVFGAFVLGLVMPRGAFSTGIHNVLTPVVSVLMLPMFFVSSGLNTSVTLLNSWALWGVAALIIAAACAGKLIACAAAARLSGETTRDSLAIGAMMNARGLMELIILNIGLERKIITPTLFSIGVIMAIITTLMASPLFDLVYRKRAMATALHAGDAALALNG